MSESNLGRNSINMQHQSNNQRALMYDLRSELSNLKTEFSKLISKPPQTTSKPKVEPRPVFKSRYSYNNHEQDTTSNSNSVSQFQFSTKRLDSSKLQKQKYIHDRNLQSTSQLYAHSKKSPTSQQYYTNPNPNTKSFYEFTTRISDNRHNETKNQVTPSKIKQYEVQNYRRYENIKKEVNKNQLISQSRKINEFSSVGSNANIQRKAQQIQQKTETESKKNCNIYNNQVIQLNQKVSQIQKQLLASSSLHCEKDNKIHKLQQTVKQLTQKLIRANQQTMDISKEKNKQIQTLKQGQINELKNQQRFYENKMKAEKNNIQLKYEGQIKNIKQVCEARLKEDAKEKQQIKQKLQVQHHKLEQFHNNNIQLERQKCGMQYSIANMKLEMAKQSQIIKSLVEKQGRMQFQSVEKTGKNVKEVKQKQSKQIGVNCQAKLEQVQNARPTSNLEQQNKQLQDKLTIYLNNIDKLSQRIKEQKIELDKTQKMFEDSNRVVQQKQLILRNVMRDFKAMEKDLVQTRKIRKDLELLLQYSNQEVNKLNLQKLSSKYRASMS